MIETQKNSFFFVLSSLFYLCEKFRNEKFRNIKNPLNALLNFQLLQIRVAIQPRAISG